MLNCAALISNSIIIALDFALVIPLLKGSDVFANAQAFFSECGGSGNFSAPCVEGTLYQMLLLSSPFLLTCMVSLLPKAMIVLLLIYDIILFVLEKPQMYLSAGKSLFNTLQVASLYALILIILLRLILWLAEIR
jgi:hypothetical protein